VLVDHVKVVCTLPERGFQRGGVSQAAGPIDGKGANRVGQKMVLFFQLARLSLHIARPNLSVMSKCLLSTLQIQCDETDAEGAFADAGGKVEDADLGHFY